MIKNNNSKIVRKLTMRSLKTGRMRNGFIILTIILSVTLLAGIIFSSFAVKETEKRQLEIMQHVLFYNLNNEQIEKLSTDSRVDCMLLLKQGNSMEVENYIVVPSYDEQTDIQIQGTVITDGRYPEKIDEIAVDKAYMSRIGRDAVIGDTLEYTFLDGTTEIFTITGFSDNKSTMNIFGLYMSKEYAENGSQLKNVKYTAAIRIVNGEKMSEQQFLDEIRNLGSEYGVARPDINENNYFLLSLTLSIQEILAIVLTGVSILLISVIVIYSIFYISVVSRIQHFGQLRTLGATSKQIKKMVNAEGTILCLIGAPAGLLIGGIFSYAVQPGGWNWSNVIIISIIIFIADYITVMFSIRKPAKIASTVSPIEASKSSGYSDDESSDTKRLRRKITTFSLARMSAKRNRKRSLMTALSLGIGGVLFITGTTMLNSMTEVSYAQQGAMRFGEVEIYLSSNAAEINGHGYTGIQMDNPINDELIEHISETEGVKNITVIEKLSVTYEYNNYSEEDSLISFNRNQFEIFQKYFKDGILDYDQMIEQKEVLISNNHVAKEIFGWKFEKGDKVKIRWYDGTEYREELFTIAGELDNNIYNNDQGYIISYNAGWFIMPEELLKSMMPKDFNMNISLIVSTGYDEKSEAVFDRIRTVIEENPLLKMDTLTDNIAAQSAAYNSIYVVILGMGLFIIVFSVINLINTLITNIMTRKKEFAMLQSIGMSNKQLAAMIQGEGLIIAAKNILITAVAGTLCGYLLIWFMYVNGAYYMKWRFPFWYMLAYTVLIILAPVIISGISIKAFHKESLVERIREAE